MEHDPQPGDIYSTSWGYDQTNVEFFQVVKRTVKSVWLRRISSEIRDRDGNPTEGQYGVSTGRLYPLPGVWARDWSLDGNASYDYEDRDGNPQRHVNQRWEKAERNGYSEAGPRRISNLGGIRIDHSGYIRHAYWYDMTEDAGAFETFAAGGMGH